MSSDHDPLGWSQHQLRVSPFPKLLGLRFTHLEPGRVTIRMPNRKDFRQYRGLTHGGAISALLDTAATFATNTLLEENQDTVTVELKVNFLRTGRGRYLEATAEALHHGRTTSITKIEVRRPDGVVCAYGTATNKIVSADD
jgi:uncharacterized protein (TIGR00369 family)